MDEKPTRPMTPAQKRFLEAAERIRTDRPSLDDFAYMARELVQVTLPHRNPGDVPEWARSNGNLTLSIRPGWATDEKSGQRRPIGYPYGTIPRLLLFWLTAEAVAAKNRGDHSGRIELGSSLAEFMFQLGLNTDNGSVGAKRSDARRLRDQMERLFNAVISFEQGTLGDGRHGDHRINMTVASESMLWWSPQDPHQAALWGSWVELSRKFFDAITAHPVPLDMRALKALKRSPLALDLYGWLTYEAYRAHKTGKGRFVAWALLAKQMGNEYAEVKEFARKSRAALRKIQALYPALKLGALRGGIRIEPDSLPAITPRQTVVIEHARPTPAAIAAAPEPPEPPEPTAEMAALHARWMRRLAGFPHARQLAVVVALRLLDGLIEVELGPDGRIDFTFRDKPGVPKPGAGGTSTPAQAAELRRLVEEFQSPPRRPKPAKP